MRPVATSTEFGALFLATMAYPGDTLKAERFAGALICGAIDEMILKPNTFGEAPEGLRLACKLRDRTEAEKIINDGTLIITGSRLIAAKMAFPEIHAYICDALGIARPANVPSHLSTEMVAAVSIDKNDPARRRDGRGRRPLGNEAEGNKGNIVRDCWTPTLPVLHLAVAFAIECQGDAGLNAGDFTLNSEIAIRVIGLSNALAPKVSYLFGIPPENQLRINVQI